MMRKDEIVLKLEELENLLSNVENCLRIQIRKEKEKMISELEESQLLLENKLYRLEKRVNNNAFPISVDRMNLSLKLQKLV